MRLISHYLEKVENIRKELTEYNSESNYSFYYRADYKSTVLTPPIYKSKLVQYEHEMISDVLTKCPSDFVGKPHMIDKLAMMQHYGLPTRLLDITSNIFAALYFACGEGKRQDNNDDKVIHILAIHKRLIKPWNSDTVSILSNIACLPKKQLDSDIDMFIENKSNLENRWNRDSLASIVDSNNNALEKINNNPHEIKLFPHLVSLIQNEKPAFRHLINIQELHNRIICVLPRENNTRIITQRGAFLLFGISQFDKDKPSDIDIKKQNDLIVSKSVDISFTELEELKNELNNAGINDSTMFPEIENVTMFIKNKYKKMI